MAADDLRPYGLCGQADRGTKIRVREKWQVTGWKDHFDCNN